MFRNCGIGTAVYAPGFSRILSWVFVSGIRCGMRLLVRTSDLIGRQRGLPPPAGTRQTFLRWDLQETFPVVFAGKNIVKNPTWKNHWKMKHDKSFGGWWVTGNRGQVWFWGICQWMGMITAKSGQGRRWVLRDESYRYRGNNGWRRIEKKNKGDGEMKFRKNTWYLWK